MYSKSAIVTKNIFIRLAQILQLFSFYTIYFSEYTFRLDVEEGVGIPKIPVHPIGYNDAEILLR